MITRLMLVDLRKRPRRTAVLCGLLGCLASASPSLAVFGTPAWSRPGNAGAASANRSTYQVFDSFSDDVFGDGSYTIEDLQPDGPDINPNGRAAFYELSGQAFVAGSGNVYGINAPLDARVTVPGYAPISGAKTMFLVQLETQGTELIRPGEPPGNVYDYSRLAINGTPLTSLAEFKYTELSRVALPNSGTFGGYIVEHAIAFTLPTTASTNNFTFKTLEFHSSLAYLSVDTFVRIAGDFNLDGTRDVRDLDLLLRAPTATPPVSVGLFDVNNDGQLKVASSGADSDSLTWVAGLAGTAYGDTNLDGDVDFDDLLALAKSYEKTLASSSWTDGDFDGSGRVNFDDLLVLAKHYGFRAANTANAAALDPAFAAEWTLAQSLVPEPTSLASLLGLAGLAARRRR